MERTCKKCGALNADAAGEELDSCPRCGAIYSKVEKVIALRAKLDAQVASNKRSANTIPSVVPPNAVPAIPAQRGPGLHTVPLAIWGCLIIILAPVTIGILEWISPSPNPREPSGATQVWFLHILIGALLILANWVKVQGKRQAEAVQQINRWLSPDGYGFHDLVFSADKKQALIIDAERHQVSLYTFSTVAQRRKFAFADILEVSIHEDGETITTSSRSKINIGRAVAGTLIAGPLGAAVGAFSGGRQTASSQATVQRLELRIVIRDVANPIIDFLFLRGSIPRNSDAYRNVSKIARTCEGALRAALASTG